MDETLRLWINGRRVGDSLGEPGGIRDEPVGAESAGKYRPGQENRIVAGAHDSRFAGGIWKPVEVRAE